VGNNLPTVTGLIETRDPIAVSGTITTQAREKSGPRYPRAHFQAMALTKR